MLMSDEPTYKIMQMNVNEVFNTQIIPLKYHCLVHVTHSVPLKHFGTKSQFVCFFCYRIVEE